MNFPPIFRKSESGIPFGGYKYKFIQICRVQRSALGTQIIPNANLQQETPGFFNAEKVPFMGMGNFQIPYGIQESTW